MGPEKKGNARRDARRLVHLSRRRSFDATPDQHGDGCHQHWSKDETQSLERLQIGIVGRCPLAERGYGLISEHWKNVDEGAVSVSEPRSRNDRPHRNQVESDATLVAEADLRDLP